jgi:glycerophosphoryl diester phosphodiesterase
VAFTRNQPARFDWPRVIGHRGACGLLPEHTIPSYQLAIESGADAIELDLVCTRDGHLIARHDVELSATTNVAALPQFAARRSTRTVDGIALKGWFAEDFTLEEIKTLRARQRYPFRNRSHDDQYGIPTLLEVLELVPQAQGAGRSVDVYLELKHATHHAAAGLAMEPLLTDALCRKALAGSESAISIESFEPTILKYLRPRLKARFVQLIGAPTALPWDLALSGDGRRYADLITPAGLAGVAEYAHGIGVWKRLIVPTPKPAADETDEASARLGPPTTLIADAKGAGLFVDAWTFRDEPRFLAADYGGDPLAEYRQFQALGLAGVITDFPQTALLARALSPSRH